MIERQLRGVQHQPARGRTAVEDVADDGRPSGRELRADLVRSTGLRFRFDKCAAAHARDDVDGGDRELGVGRRVPNVRGERMNASVPVGRDEVTENAVGRHAEIALDDREVRLLHGAAFELTGERRVRGARPREDEHAGRVAIEPLMRPEVGVLSEVGGEACDDIVASTLALAVRRDERRLVDGDDRVVVEQDARLAPRDEERSQPDERPARHCA